MKKRLISASFFAAMSFLLPSLTFAASNSEVANFTNLTLTSLIAIASIASVFFLILGGYQYITSKGNPNALDKAKHTIRNAIIGLVIVLGAGVLSTILNDAFIQPAHNVSTTAITLAPIQPTQPDSSLTQILLGAVSGFLQNIVQSAAKPIFNGIIWFLTSTPALSTNSVIFNFWLIMVGITDSLFAIIIALLGLHVMSATSFGFEELSIGELLPRIGLAFLIANTSIFIIDWIVSLCQILIQAVLNATGGITGAWILDAFNPNALLSGTTELITLIFVVVFILLAIILLLFYISRLMIIAFGAVFSPIVCLIWLIPKGTDFAENCIKTYIITIFTLFIHVVIIQLACAFLTLPKQDNTNPFISVLIGIALFIILLKSTATTVQLALASGTTSNLKKYGTQLFNVLSPSNHTTRGFNANNYHLSLRDMNKDN